MLDKLRKNVIMIIEKGGKPMKIMKIRIKDYEWKVLFVKNDNSNLESEDNENVCGITHFDKLRIYINKDIAEDLILHTITHELTHATLFSYGMGQYESFTEENVCDFVETHAREIIANADYIYNAYIKSRLDK